METIIQHNNYPVFEPNQVLTTDIMNNMVEYLEEQERLTRSFFIGIGPMCGFKVIEADLSQIIISNGAGITSDGHAIILPEQKFTHFIEYEDPLIDTASGIYPFFKNTGNEQIALLKLEKQNTADNKSLNELPDDLSNYVVLVYLERLDSKLKNCTLDDCNNVGSEVVFDSLMLLVKKEDARNIICQEEELNAPKTELQLKEIINADFRLASIRLKRFKLPASVIDHYEKLFMIYHNLILNSLTPVKQALENTYKFFNPVLNYNSNPFTTDLSSLYNQTKKAPFGIQYFYDFLCDLTEAYQEFREAVVDLCVVCFPDPEKFPRHLRLGPLQNETCEPSVYRTKFYKSPVQKQQGQIVEKIRSLHRRLVEMVNSFNVASNVPLKITPDKWHPKYFSERSIPYYYSVPDFTPLVENWSFNKKLRCLSKQHLSYHATKYASDDFVVKPLDYDINDYDFFRIEGLLGMDYEKALEELLQLKKSESLPFDLLVLKVGKDPGREELNKFECHFNDLEIVYHAWLKELECILSDKMKIFTSLKISQVVKDSPAVSTPPKESVITTDKVQKGSVLSEQLKKNINTEPDAIGEKLYFSIEKDGNKTANDYMTDTNKALKEDVRVKDLRGTDYQVAFGYPVEMSAQMFYYSEKIADDIYSINVEEVEYERHKLYDAMKAYYDDLVIYNPSGDTKVELDKEKLLKELERLLKDCAQEQLKIIEAELKRRKLEALRLNLFSEFVKNHHGLDHRGGVPKGGTFILVYHQEETAGANSNSGSNIGMVAVESAASKEMNTIKRGSTAARSKAIGGETKMYGMNISQEVKDVITKISEEYSLNERELVEIVKGATRGSTASSGMFPKPANRTIIADFYLPYVCCSKCPPIGYILPEPQVFLSLPKKNFCIPEDPEQKYKFTLFPEAGIVTGPGVVGDPLSGWHFVPNQAGVASGEIKFAVNGIEALIVNLFQIPEVDFSFEIQRSEEQILLVLTNLSSNAIKYTWKIEGQNDIVLEDTSPVEIPVKGDLQVELIGENDNCTHTTGVRNIIVPVDEKTYYINTNDLIVFCSNDTNEYDIFIGTEEDGEIANPTSDMVVCDQPAGLISPSAINPGFRFVPSLLGAGEQKFKFVIGGEEVASTAINVEQLFETGFVVTVLSVDNKSFKTEIGSIKPIKQGPTKYTWDFGAGNQLSVDNAQKFPFDYTEEFLAKLGNPRVITISLVVERGACSNSFTYTFENPISQTGECTPKTIKLLERDLLIVNRMVSDDEALMRIVIQLQEIYNYIVSNNREAALQGDLNSELISFLFKLMHRIAELSHHVRDWEKMYVAEKLAISLLLNIVRCQEKDLEPGTEMHKQVSELFRMFVEIFSNFLVPDTSFGAYLKDFVEDNQQPVWKEMVHIILDVIG